MNINQSFKQKLIDIVGSDYVIVDKQDMIVYESDGTHDKGMPDYVTLPGSVEEVSKLVILANDYGFNVVGISISEEQIKRANQLSTNLDNCRFEVMDALSLELQSSSFDAVWRVEAGPHMPDKHR